MKEGVVPAPLRSAGPSAPRVLHLTLHRKWFDEIAAGRKKEEYRETNGFWGKRLLVKDVDYGNWIPREFDEIHFRNGYNPRCPWMRVEWKGLKPGKFEGREVFAIQLGQVLETRNYPAAKPAEASDAEQSPSSTPL